MNIAVILAGGVGSRVGKNIPKQFIEICGKPILAYTVEKFQNHPDIDAIEIVCIKSYLSYMEEMKELDGLRKIIHQPCKEVLECRLVAKRLRKLFEE